MARVPADSSIGTQRAFEDVNSEIQDLRRRLNSLSTSDLAKKIEDLEKDVDMLKLLRRIPAYGQRAFTGHGRLFLDDRLNWSDVFSEVGVSSVSSTPYAVTGSDYFLLVDASSGAITVNLPLAGVQKGRALIIKKIDASVNSVTVDADGADLIDGSGTYNLPAQYNAVSIVSDGVSKWFIV